MALAAVKGASLCLKTIRGPAGPLIVDNTIKLVELEVDPHQPVIRAHSLGDAELGVVHQVIARFEAGGPEHAGGDRIQVGGRQQVIELQAAAAGDALRGGALVVALALIRLAGKALGPPWLTGMMAPLVTA